MDSLLILCKNLFVTVIAYLFIPTIFCMLRKELTLSRIKLIVGVNGFCVWLIFMIIRINAGIDGTSYAVVLWSSVAYFLMKKFCLKSEEEVEAPFSDAISPMTEEDLENEQDDNMNQEDEENERKSGVKWIPLLCTVLLLVLSIICNIKQFVKIEELEKESKFVSYKIYTKAEFLDENIVFVIEGYGDYFYTYDEMISVVGDRQFSYWAYNKELAIALGYIAAYSH